MNRLSPLLSRVPRGAYAALSRARRDVRVLEQELDALLTRLDAAPEPGRQPARERARLRLREQQLCGQLSTVRHTIDWLEEAMQPLFPAV